MATLMIDDIRKELRRLSNQEHLFEHIYIIEDDDFVGDIHDELATPETRLEIQIVFTPTGVRFQYQANWFLDRVWEVDADFQREAKEQLELSFPQEEEEDED